MNYKNDFKAFSTNNNANVVSQEGYEESRSLKMGFPPDDITVHLLNKVLRQSSIITSVLANFIATYSGNDVLDDGDLVKLATQLSRALEQKIAAEVPNASLTQKGVTQLTDKTGNSNTLAVTQKLVSDVNDNANNRLAKNQNGADIPDKDTFVKNLGLSEAVELAKNSVSTNDFNSLKTVVDSKASNNDLNKKMDVGAFGLGGAPIELAPGQALASLTGTNGFYARGSVPLPPDNPESKAMKYMNIGSKSWSTQLAFSAYKNIIYIRSAKDDAGNWNLWEYVWTGTTAKPDTNGFLKQSSPIVEIYPDGTFKTNDESKEATVERLSEGVYLITGVLGFNADAAWGGGDGGIEIPLCKNKLPLIWVDYEVMQDGSIKLMTYHREHPDAPAFARNVREGYTDGNLIDIPQGRFISVRVQMPAIPDKLPTV
ncbi:phage tail protein [Photorhabdus luminescens]|uniref:Phage tail protein n=1 Tax=Photorhabdus luminescens subsp. sonorensis TaxID=1173677 RepID=A0A5C4RKH5_PHOLU|nr:phage tail protein [Photorhabdus luminescens]TNH44087.1 phage tail protein [Photorhabdus luminescens subsp. sonorensis]